LLEADAMRFGLGSEEGLDIAEVVGPEAVDESGGRVRALGIDEPDTDPERVVPVRAAARREKLADCDEQQDVEQYGDTKAFEHESSCPAANPGIVFDGRSDAAVTGHSSPDCVMLLAAVEAATALS